MIEHLELGGPWCLTSCVLLGAALDFDETLNLLSFSCDQLNAHSITRVQTRGCFSCGYISNQHSRARLVKTLDILQAGIKGIKGRIEFACIVPGTYAAQK